MERKNEISITLLRLAYHGEITKETWPSGNDIYNFSFHEIKLQSQQQCVVQFSYLQLYSPVEEMVIFCFCARAVILIVTN